MPAALRFTSWLRRNTDMDVVTPNPRIPEVKLVTPKVVHLSEIAGREFFDAVVDTTHIVAVLVRTK